MKTIAFAPLLLIAALLRAETVINVEDTVLRAGVRRFGIGLAQHNYYDSAQMMKELLFRNPGFEGILFQSVVRLGPGGTADRVIEDQPFTQWPSGFWDGAGYEVIWSSSAAKGRSSRIAHSLAPLRAGTPNDPAGSAQGTTYLFADSDPARIPAEGDYLALRQTLLGGTGGGAASGSWIVATSGTGSVTTESTYLPPAPPGADPLLPRGQQCARLTALAAGDQASVAGHFDTLSGFIRLDGFFRLAFKARGTGGSNRILVTVRRGSLAPYVSKLIQLTDGWADYTETFEARESAGVSGTVVVSFAPASQSALLLDDVSLRQTDSDPANPTEFRDAVVNTLAGLRPGILRYVNWQDLGNSLDNSLAPVFARKRSGYSAFSTSENNLMPGLHEFLVLCEHLGSEPWYNIPTSFTTAEVACLMEYLGGSTATPYGALRAARGHPQPWTEVFPRIHLEYGNENWNNSAYRGAAITSAVPCGVRASEVFDVVKSSPHYASSRFRCVLGAQTGNTILALQLHNASSAHDVLTLAPYMAARVDTFATNEDTFGALFAEPEWWSLNPSVSTGLMRQISNQLAASTHPVPVSVYEVNLHTTQGAIDQSTLDTFTPSVGAALAIADHMLVMLRELDCRDQVFFSLAGHRYTWPDASGRTSALWGSVLDMGKTDRKRPHYHAQQMLNDALAGDLLRTTHSGDNPTWNVAPLRNRVSFTGAHHLQSYAFRDGDHHALIVFNLHRTSALDVTFSGPHAPAGAVTLRRLTSAAITDNNETSTIVAPVTTALAAFDPAQPLSLPPFSMSLLTWTQTPRQTWRHAQFATVADTGSAADTADADGDGRANLLEYALGTDPLDPADAAPALPVQWHEENGQRYLQLDVAKNPAATDVVLRAEVSADLVTWEPAGVTVLENSATRLLARDNTPLGEVAPRRFLRLRATSL